MSQEILKLVESNSIFNKSTDSTFSLQICAVAMYIDIWVVLSSGESIFSSTWQQLQDTPPAQILILTATFFMFYGVFMRILAILAEYLFIEIKIRSRLPFREEGRLEDSVSIDDLEN